MTDLEILSYIRDQYGRLIQASAAIWAHRPEVIAGIMRRESEGGLSKSLDRPGPAGRGDGLHGHGLMQIDDRSYPDFCAGEDWKDPAKNIDKGCQVLNEKRLYLQARSLALGIANQPALERAAIAAYNCGQGNVARALEARLDFDAFTTGRDYSRAVLQYAELYASLLPLEEPGPAPTDEQPTWGPLPDRPRGRSPFQWLKAILGGTK